MTETDVLVVGAGPTGLTVANLLAGYGARVIVAERNAATSDEPRAISATGEMLRVMQQIGIRGQLTPEMLLDTGARYFGARGQLLAEVRPGQARLGHPGKSQFDQPLLEELLLAAARRRPGIDLRMSTEASDLRTFPSHVEMTLTGAAGATTVRAPWLVACDGGRSPVRTALGIPMTGSTQVEEWIVIDLVGTGPHERFAEFHCNWFRFYQFWTSVEGRRRFTQAEPGWDKPGSVSAANQHLREKLTEFLAETFSDRPDLLAKVVPSYPPGAKRMLRDNGAWASALKRDNVRLETGKILEFTPGGIRTDDGAEHGLDVVIYSTGFSAQQFLASFEVTGLDGLDLQRYWHGDARAYLGITIPHFPNLFCVYGPNTNLVVNGSTVLFSELSVEYILTVIKGLLARGDAALDVREDAYEAYNDALDAENRRMAWGAAEVSSWYKNATGRVSQVWPYPLLDYWTASRDVDLSAYTRIPRPGSSRRVR